MVIMSFVPITLFQIKQQQICSWNEITVCIIVTTETVSHWSTLHSSQASGSLHSSKVLCVSTPSSNVHCSVYMYHSLFVLYFSLSHFPYKER